MLCFTFFCCPGSNRGRFNRVVEIVVGEFYFDKVAAGETKNSVQSEMRARVYRAVKIF